MPAPGCGTPLVRRPSRDRLPRWRDARLRHEDIAAAGREITIEPRENANGARAKSGGRTVPVGPELIRLYADYLHEEYGAACSDYVFVNIWAEPKGHAWSYQAAYDLVLRLRARTGIAFDPHWWRHSAATRWLRDGVPIEVVSTLLGHSSAAVTSSVYGHLTAEDARAALEKAGWFTGKEVSWQAAAGSRRPTGPAGSSGPLPNWPRYWPRTRASRCSRGPSPRPEEPCPAGSSPRRRAVRAVRAVAAGAGARRGDRDPRPRTGQPFTCMPAVSAAASRSGSPRPSSTAGRGPVSRPDILRAQSPGQRHQAAAGLLEKLIAAVRPEFAPARSPSTPPTRYSAARSAGWLPARGRRGAAGACAPLTTTGGPLRGRPNPDTRHRGDEPPLAQAGTPGLLPGTRLRARRPPPATVHVSQRGLGTCRTPGCG